MPDDALHYLAFETLIQDAELTPAPGANQRTSRYLIEDFIVSYAPSATALAKLTIPESTPPSDDRGSMAVFADPAFASVLLAKETSNAPENVARWLYVDKGLQVTRIPFTAAEAHSMETYAGPMGKIFTGGEASESRVKTDQLDRFRVIHFATHGLISADVPARSAQVLAPGDDEDGFLQVREIYQLNLQSDLVVLSA